MTTSFYLIITPRIQCYFFTLKKKFQSFQIKFLNKNQRWTQFGWKILEAKIRIRNKPTTSPIIINIF